MQIISRAEGQAVIVAENITVTILEIDGDEVLLAIDGPDDLSVYRSEDLASVLAEVGFDAK
jgi:carbon storage regulator